MTRARVYHSLGLPPDTLPPSVAVCRWDEAALLFFVAGTAVFFALAFLLWRDLPLFGARPSEDVSAYLFALLNVRELIHADEEITSRALVTLAGALTVGRWAFVHGLKPQVRLRHVSGPRLLEGKEAEEEARREAAKERGKSKTGFMRLHPVLDLPKTRWTRHTLICGSVGSGKTQIILPLVRQAFEHNLKLFLYDVKGDFTSKFPQAALVSPWDSRSRVWAIGADVRTHSQAATFASSIISLDAEGGANHYFAIAAQQLLLGAVRSLQNERGKTWGWADLAQRVNADRETFAKTLAQHYPKAAPLIADATSQASSSVLATLAAYTRVIDDLALAWGNGEGRKMLSLRDWLRDDYQGRRQIIVQAGPDAALTAAYIGSMVRLLESAIISPAMPDNELGRTLFFVLDEFPSLRVDVSGLIDKGRSKGCCVVLGIQDPVQLRQAIGADKAQALESMVGTHVVCRMQMGPSRDLMAEKFGRERLAYTGTSSGAGANGTSSTTTVHEETRAVIEPGMLSAELGVQKGQCKAWPNGFAVRALVSLGTDVWMLDFPGEILPDLQPSFLPAYWTLPVRGQQCPSEPLLERDIALAEGSVPSVVHASAITALAAKFAKEPNPAAHPPSTPNISIE